MQTSSHNVLFRLKYRSLGDWHFLRPSGPLGWGAKRGFSAFLRWAQHIKTTQISLLFPCALPWDLWLWCLHVPSTAPACFPPSCLFLIVFSSHRSPGRKPSYCFSLQQMLSFCSNLPATKAILLSHEWCVWRGVLHIHSSVRLYGGRKG